MPDTCPRCMMPYSLGGGHGPRHCIERRPCEWCGAPAQEQIEATRTVVRNVKGKPITIAAGARAWVCRMHRETLAMSPTPQSAAARRGVVTKKWKPLQGELF